MKARHKKEGVLLLFCEFHLNSDLIKTYTNDDEMFE
ncbi:hypothetical protein SAMN05444380_10639 [Thermophagus xiamenensis]|uniref:Uncharacterized protein n=1 Tax=Thermophagus xiamenensis TaxID=385682 RepID=A0A1I1XGS7_9BACT|nr:hypothetical protein SAMN05444380_10639 [Thermophagus xiamenensis]